MHYSNNFNILHFLHVLMYVCLHSAVKIAALTIDVYTAIQTKHKYQCDNVKSVIDRWFYCFCFKVLLSTTVECRLFDIQHQLYVSLM
jgi:hypothetical protein